MLSSNTSAVSGDTKYIEDYFSSYLYTGTGSAQSIVNNIDLATKGGMLWIKNRSTAHDHILTDTARGVNNYLSSNLTAAQVNDSNFVSSANTNGFSIGTQIRVNATADQYASWSFAKATKFFDVVTYTGTGSARTIAHSLGSAPGCIMVKRTDTTGDWWTYHRSLTSAGYYVRLNTTGAEATSATLWNSTAPTSTEFSLGTGSSNTSGGTYVAYLFAHDAGGFGLTGTDNVISCGSTGGGSSEITLGWEPQWLLYKSSTAVDGWHIIDNMRGAAVGSPTYHTWSNLDANTSAAETSVTGSAGNPNIRFTPTGFILGAIAGTAIYIAIRRGPMKVPTDATKVFIPVAGDDSVPVTTGFPVDMTLDAKRTGNAANTANSARLTGTKYLSTASTAAETTVSCSFDSNTTVTPNVFGTTNPIVWAFKRAPSFFDVVCYTGNQTVTALSHNLGVAPQLILLFQRSPAANVYARLANPALLGSDKWLYVNQTDAVQTSTNIWANTAPTATTFTVGASTASNITGTTYVAYLFATCPGVSKVGSFTMSASTFNVDCGFTAGARFILLKNTTNALGWLVWDSARGIVSGNDPMLILNSTAAEDATYGAADWIDPYAAGFTVNGSLFTSGTYIYLAIA